MKAVAIMQPYFLPYLGYFQLMSAVNDFVIYDDVQYTKKGWINRNRFLLNGVPQVFTVNLKQDSDYLPIKQRWIAPEFENTKRKLIHQLELAYRHAGNYNEGMCLFDNCINFANRNLFEFVFHSIQVIHQYLGLECRLHISSQIPHDTALRHKHRVWAICQSLHADVYWNSEGGEELYDLEEFREQSLHLQFLKHDPVAYPQNSNSFVSHLSIIDVIMNNSRSQFDTLLNQFTTS